MEACFTLFLKAAVIGITVAAAIGPIAILYLRRAMTESWRAGFVTAAGAASADAVYASIAAFGLTAISNALISIQLPIRVVGGLYLLFIGYKTFRALPPAVMETTPGQVRGYFLSTFLLTLTNPLTIIFFVGIFTGTGLALTSGAQDCAPALVLGVVSGSLGMATLLVTVASLFRTRMTPTVMRWINRLAGIAICAFAVSTLLGIVTMSA